MSANGAADMPPTTPTSPTPESDRNSPRTPRALRPFEWAARICFALVFLINVQCALSFILAPDAFAAAYELSDVAGEAAVRGIGVAFLMWNCTYPVFIAQPARHGALGAVILAQQAVGLVGEAFILLTLPTGHDVLAASIMRFIVFDGAGLLIMAASFAVLQKRAAFWYVTGALPKSSGESSSKS